MGSTDRSDIRVVVDTGDHYSVKLEMAGDYDVSITQGDNYHVIVETPTTIVENADIYFRVADLALIAISSSFAQTASYALNVPETTGFPFEGSAVISGSLLLVDFDGVGGITGSLFGTASYAQTASLAENIGVIFAGEYQTGSDTPVIIDPSIGLIQFVPVALPEILDGGGADTDLSSIVLDGGGA